MNKFFDYNEKLGKVVLDEPTLLLTKEFAALLDVERNKCKEDPTGLQKLRAFREMTYIYLAIDWKSLYNGYSNQEKHEAALQDSGLTEDEFNNPEFRAACRKYVSLQNSNRYVRLLEASQEVTDKIIDYFQNIDLEERNENTGAYVNKVSDIQKAMENAAKQIETLKMIESLVKKEITEQSQIRAGATEGFVPDL